MTGEFVDANLTSNPGGGDMTAADQAAEEDGIDQWGLFFPRKRADKVTVVGPEGGREEPIAVTEPGKCSVCGTSIEDKRADATTCSDKCRKQRARARNAGKHISSKGLWPPTRKARGRPRKPETQEGPPLRPTTDKL